MTADRPSSGTRPSQRTLAAIVFTDVVSFSARMHSDEVGTLKLLQRDFAEMQRLCTEHEGEVLKTTGDGLLLTFTSAVQAVACALAMQRQFAAEAKDQLPGGALQHRIGIHLGDVLVQDKDVMGDGVNIASRLQAEAEPGGICISQTVYDVVKNKLEMKVVSLGPRDLKNIAQAMPVYRLLLEAQTLDPASRDARPPVSLGRNALRGLGAIAAIALIIAAAVVVIRAPRGGSENAPVAAPPQPPSSRLAAPLPPATVAAPGPAAQAPAGAAGSDLASMLSSDTAKRRDVMREMHALYLDKYDFIGLVVALRDKGESPSAPRNLQLMLRSAEQLVKMRGWLDTNLRHHGPQHPLLVHDLSGDASRDVSVYVAPDQRVVFLEKGTPTPRELTGLKPSELGAVIASALREATETPRPVFMGALAFARLYALPSMTEALDSIKAQRERDAAPKSGGDGGV